MCVKNCTHFDSISGFEAKHGGAFSTHPAMAPLSRQSSKNNKVLIFGNTL
jgi:hypothetical protein